MENVKIPGRIDDPPHIAIIPSDEIAPVLIGLTIGIMAGKAFIFTALGFSLTIVYKKFRDNHQDGYFLHFLYHYGFIPTKSRLFINPYIRRLFP